MAAKVAFVYSCPRCGEGMTSQSIHTKCPACGLILGSKEEAPYQPPYTLTEQHVKYRDAAIHLNTILNLDREKSLSILNDGLSIVEMIGAKKGSEEDIRSVLDIAIRIGQIAEAYKDFLDANGIHVPTLEARIDGQRVNTTISQENSNEPHSGTSREGSSATE